MDQSDMGLLAVSSQTRGGGMSRGHGQRQRHILQAVEEHGWCYLKDILTEGHTKADYNATHRAALKLWRDGSIEMCWWLCDTHIRRNTTIGPAGSPRPERDEIVRVGQVPSRNLTNTYQGAA